MLKNIWDYNFIIWYLYIKLYIFVGTKKINMDKFELFEIAYKVFAFSLTSVISYILILDKVRDSKPISKTNKFKGNEKK